MTATQFEGIWSSNYPLTPPIAYLLKEAYPERWFRIHSLPESKRYPEDESELDTILSRHNTLITDILGSHSEVLLVTGEYDSVSGDKASWQFSASDSLKHLPFTQLTPIPLDRLFGKTDLARYDPGDLYRPVFSQVSWQPTRWDGLLKETAEGQALAFFLSIDQEVIIAPYDGGIDVILKDSVTRDTYKAVYKNWLSGREDGL